LPYYVRLMCKEDIPQVNEINREAFPTQLPPPNYNNELNNKLAKYIVAYTEEEKTGDAENNPKIPEPANGLTTMIKNWFHNGLFSGRTKVTPPRQRIVGFAGMWILLDEAHITNIAVRQSCQGGGVGELLLISIIDLAAEMKARMLTLEVRVSNTVAQNLYTKYAFTQVGLRRGYYTDNREDGVLMSTDNITSQPFQAHFQKLKQAHAKRHGIALYRLTNIYPSRVENR